MSFQKHISERHRRSLRNEHSSRWAFVLTILSMLACMSIYEFLKESIAPGLTKWQSHGVTIVFSSILTAAAAAIVQRRFLRLYGHYERISANAPGMVYRFVLSPEGTPQFEFVSEGCRGIYGLSPSEIRADTIRVVNFTHPDDRASFDSSVMESARTLEICRWEGRIRLPGGVSRWIQGCSRPERRPDGSTVWDGVLVDITDRKSAQMALQQAHEELETRVAERTREAVEARDFLRGVIDAVPSMIFIKDEHGRFLMVNRSLAQIFGVEPEEITGRLEVEVSGADEEEIQYFREIDNHVIASRTDLYIPEEIVTDSTGARRWFQTVKRPLVAADGSCRQLLGVSTEITERKAAEEEIWRLHNQMELSLAEVHVAYDATIEAWAHFLDLRDKETEGHSRRVTEMTLRLAQALGFGDEELVQVRRGALLHDIGKMGVPDAILLKPGSLDDEEWRIMRLHPTYAYDLLQPIAFLAPAMDIPYCHHERWDGAGYPRGLAGAQIPVAARIFAVVDVWDALRSDRPYRRAWPAGRVIEHIRGLSGTHFDPWVVDAFLEIVDGSNEIEYAAAA